MKAYFYTISFLLLSVTFNAQNNTEHLKTIDDFLTVEYPKKEPGAVVLIARNDTILFKKAYGLASMKPKRKLNSNMVFQIGSMSKQFVSAAVLQLVEQGKLKLEDPIQKYVPYYPIKKHPVTLHHLLSQTSGIPDYFDVDDNEFELLAKTYTPKQLLDFYKNEPLQFKPGEQWQYSNSNYPLLGLAIENVTGLTLRDYLDQHIFKPLSMNDSGLWYTDTTKEKNIVKGYYTKNNRFVEGPKISSSALYAPGGIVSTVNDLYKWNTALKNRNVISEFVVNHLIREQKTSDGKGTAYGYGLALKTIQGSPTIQHSGILFGFTSTGMYLPNEGIYLCILSNSKFDRAEELANYCASVILNKPLKIYSKSEISEELLKDYLGTFQLQSETLERTFELIVFDNQLVLHDPKTPQNDAILTPAGTDKFVLKTAGAYFQFIRDVDNNVIGYSVEQNGETYNFKKMK